MGKELKTSDLKDQDVANQFYESRYQEGYMDEWPEWKKLRIIEIIQELVLPSKGKALDFGCGRGIFTKVLKRALPNWEITGCDISNSALENARAKFPNCSFSLISDLQSEEAKFDFIFSHHVLEHVLNVEESILDIVKLQSEGGVMLHVLPCGNKGSLESNLSSSLPEGVDKEIGNRFYYEDVGHLRRLTSSRMDEIFKGYNYKQLKSWFANHEFGSLEWMSDSPESFINEKVTDLSFAKGDKKLEHKLLQLRQRIKRLKLARKFATQGSKHRIKTRLLDLKKDLRLIFKTPFLIASDLKHIKEGDQFKSDLADEWTLRKHKKHGSEMYLAYIKPLSQESFLR